MFLSQKEINQIIDMSVLGFMHSENSPSTPSKGTLLSSDSLIWHNYFKKVKFAFYGTYVYFMIWWVAFIIHMDSIFISLFHRILNYYRRVYSFYVLYFALMLILARLVKCQILDQDCDLHIFYCIISMGMTMICFVIIYLKSAYVMGQGAIP